jgi:V8-like Glu-specific endopeptidase
MLKRFFFVLINLLFCMSVFPQSNDYNPFATQQPTDWSGTGWLLNKGYVVTNHHVSDNARTIKLKFPKENGWDEYTAEVAISDPENDLAILRITSQDFNSKNSIPYALKISTSDVGESVFVLGYPMITTMGEEIKLTTGIISSHSGYQGLISQYQISAPVQPGNSGGPLFDDYGNVIGVVNSKHTGAENVSYAIKSSYVKELIKQLPDTSNIIPSNNSLSEQNLPGKVKKVKPFVCFIECSSRGETPKSSNPKYGASVVTKGDKVVDMPYVDFAHCSYNRIKQVTITENETIIDFSCVNIEEDGYFEWISINKDTYIVYGDNKYKLKKAEGIEFAPNKTYYEKVGETKYFKLIFPAIPKSVTSFDLIEPGDSDWKFYGISLKEY